MIMKKINDFLKKNNISINKIKKDLLKFLFLFIGVAVFIILWIIIGRILITIRGLNKYNDFLFIPTLKRLLILIRLKYFWISLLDSLKRIIIGLFIASLIGIPIGLLIGFYKYMRYFTAIPIQFIRMMSPITWIPLALILIPGKGFEIVIYFLITITTVWPIILNTMHGVMNIDPRWIKMAQNQGAKDYQLLFYVIFPASLPSILNGYHLAIAVAWIVLVPAEILGISSGLGYLINNARDSFEYDELMALIIVVGILGFTLDFIFQIIRRKLDWRNR